MQNQEYEIDLLEIAKLLWYNWKKIVACTIVGAVIGFAFVKATSQSQAYVATARFAISLFSSSSTSTSSTATYAGDPNSLLGSQLTVDSKSDSVEENENQYSSLSDAANVAAYAGEIIKNGVVLQPVIDALGLKTTCTELAASITTESTGKGPILQIDVVQGKEDEALAICKTIVDYAPSLVMSVTDISDITVISEPTVVREAATSPVRNTASGAVIGFVLAAGVLVVRYLMSTLIRKEEDITNMLGVKVLGVIPAVKEGTENA